MFMTILAGVAFGGPLDDSALLPLADLATRHLATNLEDIAGKQVHVFERSFTDEVFANAFVQRAQRYAPGDDIVVFQVDHDRDGQPELLQLSRRVDVSRLEGLTFAIDRPLLIDTDGDGVTDRIAFTGTLPRLTASR